MSKHLIVVYGTLKRGEGNCNYFLGSEKYIKDVITLPKYRIYDNGSFPMMIEDDEHGTAINCELWEVSGKALKELDRLEGCPHMYKRKTIDIEGMSEKIQGYIYQGNIDNYIDCSPAWYKKTKPKTVSNNV